MLAIGIGTIKNVIQNLKNLMLKRKMNTDLPSSQTQIMQDLMVRYIKLIGTDVKQRAELCNRTQPDIVDLQVVKSNYLVSKSRIWNP